LALAAIAGLAISAFVLLGAGSGMSQTMQEPGRLPQFMPTGEQRASLQMETVTTRVFHTEIVTDGYVAPNGGFTASGLSSRSRMVNDLPILPGQSSDVLQAENDLTNAKAQFRTADANEKRQHALYDTGGAALKDWQQAQADLTTAIAAVASARNRLHILGKTDAEIAMVEGQSAPATNAVFFVGDLSTVWLIANVREADAALIRGGDAVEVHVPAFPDMSFKTSVSYVASLIDPVTHRLAVGAKIRNAGGKLKPNMQATFTILAGQSATAPAVPQNAVIYEDGKASVWVVDPTARLVLRTVTIGRINGNYAEVTNGLSAGERIVAGGALFLDQASGHG
jgi:cobalt-zinc-cadmium efflux system membrane fusion protein